MNARQKCKHLKKQLTSLYADYVTSAMATQEVMNVVAGNMQKMREQQVVCTVSKQYPNPDGIDDAEMFSLYDDITYDPTFRQAVVFEGHTDPDTGKYILEAKLTVVIPEFDEEGE